MYSKIALASSTRLFHLLAFISSACTRPPNASMTALSKQSPMLPIDGSSPAFFARSVNAQDTN